MTSRAVKYPAVVTRLPEKKKVLIFKRELYIGFSTATCKPVNS